MTNSLKSDTLPGGEHIEKGNMRIAIATGTRADWGLLMPLASELRRRGADIRVIATNMHLLPECGHTVDEITRDGFGPHATVPCHGTPSEITADTLRGFSETLTDLQPDAIVILGDRFEMLGAASAALLTGIPIIHIAGGTVSEGAFDDSIRHAITKMATLHLVETELCRSRVVQMGENPEDVIVTGAIGVFNAMNVTLMNRQELEISLGFSLEGNVVLATLHAATRDPNPPAVQMKNLIEALSRKMEEDPEMKVVFTYPNNDVDSSALIEAIEKFAAENNDRVLAIPSLGRLRYLSMLRVAMTVVGNSSSGLVEVPSAGIPTLDIGIRQQGRECGESVLHCGSEPAEIAAGLDKVLSANFRKKARTLPNPYFKENTPGVMAEAILSREWAPFPAKRFHSLQK